MAVTTDLYLDWEIRHWAFLFRSLRQLHVVNVSDDISNASPMKECLK